MAVALEQHLVGRGIPAYLLDGDNLRHGLNGDLGFDAASRNENVRRAGEVALLFADAGVVAIVPADQPLPRRSRPGARRGTRELGLRFVEVFVDTPIELCEQRDVKGLYAKARAGEITGFTGIDDPYEAPTRPGRWCSPPARLPTKPRRPSPSSSALRRRCLGRLTQRMIVSGRRIPSQPRRSGRVATGSVRCGRPLSC